MNRGLISSGISGVMNALELLKKKHSVTQFKKAEVMQQTPHLDQPLKLHIPIYKNNLNPTWIYRLGLWLYYLLAGKQNLGQHQSLAQQQIRQAWMLKKTCK
jgi:glycerol-3-phosphate dehydrogenase